jgi:hypothetical protein
MAKPLTYKELKAAKAINIQYTCDIIPEGEMICPIFKFERTGVGTVAYLSGQWIQYGPKGDKGETYDASKIFSQPLAASGVFSIPTDKILSTMKDGEQIIQFGIADFGEATSVENDIEPTLKVTGVTLS